jgi:6-phosphofructo-2-kinase/fructose-2,6-biphosphatase 4
MVPGSPEDIKIPVAPSGAVSPLSGVGTPAQAGSGTATPQHGTQPLSLKSHINPLN